MQHRKSKAPYVFIAPYALLFVTFSVFPILYGFYISLNNWNGLTPPIFTGIENYLQVVRDPRFFMALKNTLIFMAMIIPPQIVIGFLLAYVLNSSLVRGRGFFRTMYFMPYLTTAIAIGTIFGHLFERNFGLINQLLVTSGAMAKGINWTGDVWWSRTMISFVTVWRYVGYTSVIFMAGLMNINPDLYEAAEIDGANGFQKMWRITLPMLRSVSNFIIITTVIGCFGIFEEPFMIFDSTTRVIGGPGYSSLTGMWLFYDTAFSNAMRYGYAGAISFSLFIFLMILTFFVNKLLNVGGDQ